VVEFQAKDSVKSKSTCTLGKWSPWSACMNPCTKNMRQVRHRLVRRWGRGCASATLRNVRRCLGMAKRCTSLLGQPLCPKVKSRLPKRFLGNLMALQAYAQAIRGRAAEFAKSYKHASVVEFLVLFGQRLKKKNKCSIERRYKRIRQVLLHQFRRGLGRAMLEQLHYALIHNKNGALATRVYNAKPYFVLNHKSLGLLHFIGVFDKRLKVLTSRVDKNLRLVKADTVNQKVQQVAFSVRSGPCVCNGASITGGTPTKAKQIGYQCQKWTEHDARPWCIVSRKCKTASRMTNLSYGRHYWKYCDKYRKKL